MNGLLEITASNCLVAAGLASVVWIIGRRHVNPALVHVLFLLVFIKLFTPPLVSVDLSSAGFVLPVERPEMVFVGDIPKTLPETTSKPWGFALIVPHWRTFVVGIWATGIVVCLGITAYRVVRFQRLLRRAKKADTYPELITKTLCGKMGVQRVPDILLLPARVTPAVWSLTGRPRIIIPLELIHSMSRDRLETIIAHELAHIRRRDHLVRLLEICTMTVFWWNPVVWWVRRQLREVEEECCDAIVLETLANGARDYAIALIETVEFLSRNQSRPPVGATAAQPAVSLVRRIEMLKAGTNARRLTARSITIALCLFAVPMAMTFAFEPPSSSELLTKSYDLGFLRSDAKQMEKQIISQVEPKKWGSAGGPFTLRRTRNGQLVVLASRAVHEQIDLILQLRELQRRQKQLTARLNRLRGRGQGMGLNGGQMNPPRSGASMAGPGGMMMPGWDAMGGGMMPAGGIGGSGYEASGSGGFGMGPAGDGEYGTGMYGGDGMGMEAYGGGGMGMEGGGYGGSGMGPAGADGMMGGATGGSKAPGSGTGGFGFGGNGAEAYDGSGMGPAGMSGAMGGGMTPGSGPAGLGFGGVGSAGMGMGVAAGLGRGRAGKSKKSTVPTNGRAGSKPAEKE